MKAIWGREPDLAVAETADHEALDCATWTIAALGASAQQITQRLDQIEKDIRTVSTLPFWMFTGKYSDSPGAITPAPTGHSVIPVQALYYRPSGNT